MVTTTEKLLSDDYARSLIDTNVHQLNRHPVQSNKRLAFNYLYIPTL